VQPRKVGKGVHSSRCARAGGFLDRSRQNGDARIGHKNRLRLQFLQIRPWPKDRYGQAAKNFQASETGRQTAQKADRL
jgi:hypothetical protein